MTADLFESCIGANFRVEGGRHVLTLASVTRAAHAPPPGLRAGFVLIFAGPVRDVLPEGFRRLALDDGRSFDMHVMPIHTPAPDRQDYQAVFN